MRVTAVHVERRQSDGNYGNRMMAVTAELDEGEDAGPALDSLMVLVQDRIEREERREEEKREAYRQAQLAKYRAEREEEQRRFQERHATEPRRAGLSETDPFGEGGAGDDDEDAELE